jgi:hypothetical protein
LKKEVSNMEELLVILVAVFMVFGFMVFGHAHNLSSVGTSYAVGTSNQTGKMGSQITCAPGKIYVGEISWVYPDT